METVEMEVEGKRDGEKEGRAGKEGREREREREKGGEGRERQGGGEGGNS